MKRSLAAAAAIIAFVIVAYVAGDAARSFNAAYRYQKRINRVAPSDVQLDSLELTFVRGHYHLSGTIHNLSPTYTLSEVTISLVIDDCVNGECHEQAQGTAHAGCHVPPAQSARFEVEHVSLSAALTPRGERRLTSRVSYTVSE